MELVTLFYLIDEFCKEYEPQWQQTLLDSGVKQRRTTSRLSLAEVLTIVIWFHSSGYRMFKWYYEREVLGETFVGSCFPHAVSYTLFRTHARRPGTTWLLPALVVQSVDENRYPVHRQYEYRGL